MSTMCAGERPTCSTRPQSFREPGVRGAVLGLYAAVIWGSYLALAKAGINAGLGAFDIALLRYAVAGLLMWPWLIMHGLSDLGGVGWRRGPILTLLAGPFFVLIGVGGYKFAPLAHGAMFQPAGLILGGLALAAVVFERTPTQRVLGVIVMLLGLAILSGPGLLSATSLTPIGDVMFLSAGMMWAGFSMRSIRWFVPPLAATASVSVLSALIYVPVHSVVFGWHRLLSSPVAMIAIQVLVRGVLSGVVAVIAFAKAIQLIGPAKAAVFPAFVPAAALIIGIPMTGEVPTPLQSGGLCLVTAGLLLAIVSR